MGSRIILIVLTVFLFNCSTKIETDFAIPKFNTQITGEIPNYDSRFHDYTVTLLIPNIVTDDTDVALAFVDSTQNTFNFNFNLDSPQMMIVRYAAQNFYVYVKEGDSIRLEIDVDDEYPPNCQFHVTQSSARDLNQFLNPWIKRYDQINRENRLPQVGNATFFEYNKALQNNKRMWKSELDELISNNNIPDEEFAKIVKEIIRFAYVSHLISYKIFSDNAKSRNYSNELISSFPDLEMEKTLPLIIDSLDLNDPRLLENSYFHYFYNTYSAYIRYLVRDLCKSKYSDCTETLFNQTYLEYVRDNFESQTLDLLLSRYLFGKIRALEIQKRPDLKDQFLSLLDSSDNKISFENRAFLETEFDRVNNLIKGGESGQIKSVEQNVSGIEIWDKLLDTYEGKVVYVKFWAPWCGPCMSNWKSADNLAKSYSEDDLKVLAVCIWTDEAKWRETMPNLTTSVDHIYLDQDHSNIVSTQFGITSIPRNLIYDRNGKLIHFDTYESGSRDGQLSRHLQEILLNAF